MTPTSTMTSRQRMLATLRGEETDRLPVWLKMANATWQHSQVEPYRSMPAEKLLRAAGCDLVLSNPSSVSAETPHARFSIDRRDGIRRTTAQTPDGALVAEETFDPFTQTWHPTRHMAADPADFAALRWLFRDTRYRADPAKLQAARALQLQCEAAGAITTAGINAGPLMRLIEDLCGPEAAIYHMSDNPALFAEVIQLMHEDRLRHLQALLPVVAADTFWLTENTSTTLMSPAMFSRFCVPHLRAYGQMILEHGRIPVHHMCGKLNALLELIDPLPAMVNEAYTTRPVGDASLAEGRRRMPSKTLMGGTNATLWLKPVDDIVGAVAKDLAACPDRRRIFLTSAGVLPAAVSFEKAKAAVTALREV